jgi:hypothetical protein
MGNSVDDLFGSLFCLCQNFLSFNVQVHELFYVSGYVSAYLFENQFHDSWECVL